MFCYRHKKYKSRHHVRRLVLLNCVNVYRRLSSVEHVPRSSEEKIIWHVTFRECIPKCVSHRVCRCLTARRCIETKPGNWTLTPFKVFLCVDWRCVTRKYYWADHDTQMCYLQTDVQTEIELTSTRSKTTQSNVSVSPLCFS